MNLQRRTALSQVPTALLLLLTAACASACNGGEGGSDPGSATAATTGADETTGGSTAATASGSESTTGDSEGASICEGACGRLVDCEFEEDVRECLSWCDELRTDAAMADPRIFPLCAALVEKFFECIAQDNSCFEDDPCSNFDLEIEEQCGCDRYLSLNSTDPEDGCSYGERCGVVSREILCIGGTCVCEVGGQVVGECQSQAMICVDPGGPDIDPQVSAAGECCGWVPFGPLK